MSTIRSPQATGNQKKDPGRIASSERKAFIGRPRSLSDGIDRSKGSGDHLPQQNAELQRREPEGAAVTSDRKSVEQLPHSQESADPQLNASSQNAAEAASEEVQIAVIQLEPAPEASKDVLRKLMTNILKQPGEQKFRKVRLANPRIKESIVEVEGALELLQVGNKPLISLSFPGHTEFSIATLPHPISATPMHSISTKMLVLILTARVA